MVDVGGLSTSFTLHRRTVLRLGVEELGDFGFRVGCDAAPQNRV